MGRPLKEEMYEASNVYSENECNAVNSIRKYLSVAILVVCIAVAIWGFFPRPITTIMGIDSAQVHLCGIIVNGKSGISNDIQNEQLTAILKILEITKAQFVGSNADAGINPAATEYYVFFQCNDGRNATAFISSDGYLIYSGKQYKILQHEALCCFLEQNSP